MSYENDEQQSGRVELNLERYRAALLDSAGLDSIPEPTPLIDGILFRDSLVWIEGRPGGGKSFAALDMAASVGTGEPWLGHRVPQAGRVMYLVAEGASGVKWRVRAWETAQHRVMDDVRWLPIPVQAGIPAEWEALVMLVKECQPDMIVIDTQARVTVGMEENAAKDMGIFVDKLENLRCASNACVVVVHHQGRTGDHMRGSTALEGAAVTVITVSKDADIITICCRKQKDGEEFPDVRARLVPIEDSAVLTPMDATTITTGQRTAAHKMTEDWWDSFGDDLVSTTQLEKAKVAASSTFYRHREVLIQEGTVHKDTSGAHTKYRLLTDPRGSR